MPVQQQIINGQYYDMYSPQWYDAMHAEALRSSTAAGTAAGSSVAAANAAAGLPPLGSALPGVPGTSVASASGNPATVPPPSLSGLTAAAGSNPGTVGAPGAPSGTAGTGYNRIAPVDTSAAEAASFNKAKDQVGLESSGALTGLRAALGGRNLLGGGLEGMATTQAATSAAGELGDVSRQQAVTRADEAQKNAQANFEGGITQRGQDFQKEEAGNSLAGELAIAGTNSAVTQRGQDISNANAQRALALDAANLASQQRTTALAGLEAALKVSSPTSGLY